MTDEDMLMEYQMALADLAKCQLGMFGVRALHRADRRQGLPTMCMECHQAWPCSTRKVLDS